MKIYILTFLDINNYGFGTKDVEIFKTREEAVKRMVEDYKSKGCESLNSGDSLEDCDEYSYAYSEGGYYWDIFEKEIEL